MRIHSLLLKRKRSFQGTILRPHFPWSRNTILSGDKSQHQLTLGNVLFDKSYHPVASGRLE